MALPKLNLPLFELQIPSTGETVTYRPFTVKEEKILLIAQESKDINQIVLAIKQIISNCIKDINVENMPMFDMEYIMLNIRSKSVDNNIEFEVEDPDTKEKIKLSLNIDKDLKVHRNEKHTTKIKADDNHTLIMRYPTINELSKLSEISNNEGGNNSKVLLDVMLSCIDVLASNDGDNVYKLSEFSIDEVKEFVESLSGGTIKQIQTFFETMPTIRVELPYKLKDGTEKTYVIQGQESFFM